MEINSQINETVTTVKPETTEERQKKKNEVNAEIDKLLNEITHETGPFGKVASYIIENCKYLNWGTAMNKAIAKYKEKITQHQRGHETIEYLEWCKGGFVPPYKKNLHFGYRRHISYILEAIPEQAQTVRDIYETFVHDDVTVASLTKMLKEFEYKNGKGKQFSKAEVQQILEDVIYTGYFEHYSFIFKGNYKPIIPAELWNKVQAKLGRPSLEELIRDNTLD